MSIYEKTPAIRCADMTLTSFSATRLVIDSCGSARHVGDARPAKAGRLPGGGVVDVALLLQCYLESQQGSMFKRYGLLLKCF